MTSIGSVFAAFGIILIDLAGRAGLDKVLAIAGDPTMVAKWAQLQSIVELVSAVSLAGVLQGLTVLISKVNDFREERRLLRSALKLGILTSLVVTIVLIPVVEYFRGGIKPDLILLAALSGCIAVIPATLNAYWLGKHWQHRMLGLALLSSLVLILVAASAWFGFSLRRLMLVQVLVLAIIGIAIWRYLNQLTSLELSLTGNRQSTGETRYFNELVNFVPVGLAIGIMSPISMLLIRAILADSISWSDVGFLQALWRSTEWVTATAAGVLSLIFLPRLSATYGSAHFKQEMLNAGIAVLIPAACLLMLIYLNQRLFLATLYDTRFAVSDMTAALFMMGSWIRIASWLFLFGLFAAHRTRIIIFGEVLSLPLYAMLLWLFAEGMTLERSAMLYLISYLVYLGFNAISLLYSLRLTNCNPNDTD